MASVITQQEVDALRAPFPLEAHSIREGNKTKDGKKIQWFVYVEKTAVEDRLNDVFPGEWGSSQPVLTPIGNGVAATISISIRGISRGNTGEDTNGTEKAKGATTDAFRRAAADWGVAKYLWEMELKIWTESYPDKDYAARDAREKEAMNKFAGWYKQKFGNITQLNQQRSPQQALKGNGPAERTIAPKTAQNGSNNNEGLNHPIEHPENAVGGASALNPAIGEADPYQEWELKNAVLKTYYNNNTFHMNKSLDNLKRSGQLHPGLTLEQAILVVETRKETA